ncbi:hypothetical protein Tco_0711217 [Tanacetum coccineum]
MSDSEDSTVTYTTVSSPIGGLSDIGSLGVDGPPVMPEDPYAYVVAAFQAPSSPDYVPGPGVTNPSPELFLMRGYVPESNPEEDSEEDDDEDPKEDPNDYPADGGDDDDDEDESSDDDEDDNDVDIEEDKEEEEHLAPADSIAVAFPAVEHAPSAKETELFETDKSAATSPPHPAYPVTARMSIRDEPPTPFWPEAKIARLLAIPSPPPSPLSLWSSPLPQIPSPPLPVSSPVPVSPPPLPASPTYLLGYKAAMIRLRAETPSTSHLPPLGTPPSGTSPLLPIPTPTSSPSLLLPSTDHGADKPEVCLPPRKRLCFAFGPRYEIGESSSAPAARPTGGFRADYGFVATLDREIRRDPKREVGYGIIDTWDEMLKDMPGAPATDETKLGRRMTNFVTTVKQDTDEIYVRLGKAQDERSLMSGRLNTLKRDRRSHAHTTLLMEREARLSHEAWRWSMDASDLARSEIMALHTQVVAHQSETLRLMSTLQT